MVIFGRSVFYLFGRLVNNSAVQFSIYSAVWIRPYVEVRIWGGKKCYFRTCLASSCASRTQDSPRLRGSSQDPESPEFVTNKKKKFRLNDENLFGTRIQPRCYNNNIISGMLERVWKKENLLRPAKILLLWSLTMKRSAKKDSQMMKTERLVLGFLFSS